MAYVVVTGMPGSGKSTLATDLAKALRVPLLSRDLLKEQLAAAVGVTLFTRDLSRLLGEAAFEAVFSLAAERHVAVIEASWPPDKGRHRLAELPNALVEVHCACAPDVARSRYVGRASRRHDVHADSLRFDEVELWSESSAASQSLSVPVIEVDTAGPVDIEAVVRDVRQHPGWSERSGAT